MLKVSPSTNPCEESKLVEYVKELQSDGADFVHCDVMRQPFVENNCLMDSNVVKSVKENSVIPLDIHLMINEPLKSMEEWLKLRPVYLTTHYEAWEWKDVFVKGCELTRKYGAMVGLAIKPTTFINEIESILPMVDLVLVMGVEPGKSGQKMLSNTIPKVEELHQLIYKKHYNVKIEVDGGIDLDNARKLYLAGADIVVMGKAMYSSINRNKLVRDIHALKLSSK